MSTDAKVWTRFTKIRNGKELKFRIQEVPKDKLLSIYELMFEHYMPEEPVHKASKLTQRVESFEEFKQGVLMLANVRDYQIDACYTDDDSSELKLVGASIMILDEKDETSTEIESIKSMVRAEEIKKFYSLLSILNEACDVMKIYKLDKYYDDKGLAVHPDYRGLGIAGELLKVRMMISKERGIPITGAWMSSLGTQKAAAKLGWETICDLDYKELGIKAGVEFNELHPSMKMMIVKH